MFPSFKQRLVLAAALIVAIAAGEVLARVAFGAVVGRGAALFATDAPVAAVLALVGWTIVIGIVAAFAGSAGNSLGGPFVIGGGLLYVAARGGSIDPWIRGIDAPSAYAGLAGETVVWAIPIVTVALALHQVRSKLRQKVPALLHSAYSEELLGDDADPAPFQAGAAIVPIVIASGVVYGLQRPLFGDYIMSLAGALVVLLGVWALAMAGQTMLDRRAARPTMRSSMGPAFLSGAVVAAVGGAGLTILIRSADPGQVIGSMLVAFTIAGLAAHQMYPTRARLTMLLAPLMLSAAACVWTAMDATSVSALLARYYTDYVRAAPPVVPLNPLALALPIYYASAGVVGVVLGIGWSQTIHAARQKHVTVTA